DEDGYLVLVDRIKEVIVRGGESIYPKELEDVFHGHADVLEACVIGRPDDLYGEVPVAYVVPLPGHALEPDALRNYCEERLARYKVPREINVLNALPKSATGKILKPALRAS
ncbi:MAG TPA: AMP-dependent synthetase, partial [Marmoricola sp.]|nr:AMP-dependent synthetase [Marmoricola sp.]